MAKVWLTYAWADNRDGDVDFAVQELTAAGVDVRLDRWNIGAGKRLWEQIAQFIQDPAECDAWMLYATQNSIGSEPCREEIAYALDRALTQRGQVFPVIGLFPGPVGADLIPAPLRTRLYVSMRDADWKERIKAAAEGRQPAITQERIEPFAIKLHRLPKQILIEVRPRAGRWTPFVAGIPIGEKDRVNPSLVHGSSGRTPATSMVSVRQPRPSNDGSLWVLVSDDEATPTHSFFVVCEALPSILVFGPIDGQKYQVSTSNLG